MKLKWQGKKLREKFKQGLNWYKVHLSGSKDSKPHKIIIPKTTASSREIYFVSLHHQCRTFAISPQLQLQRLQAALFLFVHCWFKLNFLKLFSLSLAFPWSGFGFFYRCLGISAFLLYFVYVPRNREVFCYSAETTRLLVHWI